ncbi:MAG: hypothetical protein M5U34_01835 [Chloroflexi bacterium]|nr:hypothetical protein [Chloroflexota bacterium]
MMAGRRCLLTNRRRVTTVFQRPFLLNRSVEANVKYGLKLRGQRDGKLQVEQALKQVGLLDLAEQKPKPSPAARRSAWRWPAPSSFSQKCCCWMNPPPTLTPANVALIEEIVRNLNQQQSTTMALVTHNIFQAKRLAHRVAFLLEGKIVETADSHTFFTSPQDPRTAAFVGGEMVY